MVFVHVKANKEGCKGIVKKASLRSSTEKNEVGEEFGEKSICIRNHKMNRVNGSFDFFFFFSEVLD
jgi:hypothetical protein